MLSTRSSRRPGAGSRRAAAALALAATAGVAAGCSLLLGELAECSSDADCTGGLVCQETFCVVTHDGAGGSAGIPGCNPLGLAAGEANPVMVGILVFLTGSDGTPEANGTVTLHAVQLGLEELNSREGTGTRLFDAFACDTHGDAATARAQAAALAAAGVPCIVGPDSSRELLAVAAATTPAGTLVISPSATSPEITYLQDKQHPDDAAGLVWRTAPSDALQGAVLAKLLTAAPPPSVSGIVVDDPYGDGLWSVFAGAYSGANQRELYRREEDVGPAVTNSAAFGPDLVMIVAFPSDAVKIVDAMAAKPELAAVPLVFTDSARSTDLFLVQEPARLEGARGTAPASPRGTEFQSFLSRYNARFPEDPTQFALIEHAYDAAYLVGLGASWAAGPTGEGEVTGPRIAEGLTHVSWQGAAETLTLQPGSVVQARAELQAGREINVTGASGLLDFDNETGEAPSQIEEWVIQGGAFVTLGFHDPP